MFRETGEDEQLQPTVEESLPISFNANWKVTYESDFFYRRPLDDELATIVESCCQQFISHSITETTTFEHGNKRYSLTFETRDPRAAKLICIPPHMDGSPCYCAPMYLSKSKNTKCTCVEQIVAASLCGLACFLCFLIFSTVVYFLSK